MALMPTESMGNKGTLIPIGGNEDKGMETDETHSLEFVHEGILSHVVAEAGGIHAKIIVIPTASSIPDEVAENYLAAFAKLECTNVSILDIRDREQSEAAGAIEAISAANCVMFSGGNQSKITDKIGGTKIHDIMLDRYQNEEGFVIAGTSAGAMVMSHEMIAGGSSTEAFVKGAVRMYKGLGFLPQLVVDSHFIKRGRFGRLAGAVAKYPDLIGVGLAEDTGLIIKDGSMLVIGSGMTIVFDGRRLEHNNEEILEDGTPMTLTNLTTHVLANSDRFNIQDKRVEVLPVDAPFV